MNINNGNNISLVFIPDYLVPTFKSVGLSLENIDQVFNRSGNNDDKLKIKTILERISKRDITDLSIANKLCNGHFLGAYNTRYSSTDTVSKFIDSLQDELGQWINKDDQEFKDFINYYSDNSNIMSGDNVTLTFDLVTHSNTLFVVLHKGFTNFISYNNLEFIEQFNNLLFKHLLINFGENVVYNNSFLFKSFLKQI